MHEMGLAQGILEIALDAAAGEKVRCINLSVGRRQMVQRDSLEFSFRLVSEGTVAAEASFALKEVPVRLACHRCSSEAVVDTAPWTCRLCGAFDVDVVSGDELSVDAVELESGRVIARADAGAV